ncbi:MAG: hypothetical protein HYV26_07340, partial [Candidatus Hydrogenedentes bacterium]|nr:hypothetical protein [Candidatus Hydrogenedentota bacterium]
MWWRLLSLAIPVAASATAAVGAPSPDSVWTALTAPEQRAAGAALDASQFVAGTYQLFHLDSAALAAVLATAPREQFDLGVAGRQALGGVLSLPVPGGDHELFEIYDSPVMAPALAVQYPEIKTYYGWSLDNLGRTAAFDVTPAGFHGQILGGGAAVYIDPVPEMPETYRAYYQSGYRGAKDFICETPGDETAVSTASGASRVSAGLVLHTFRLALACTFEYTQFAGGTAVGALAAMNTTISRVNNIYRSELAIRLELVPNNNQLISTDAADGYTQNGGSATLQQENQIITDAVIGDANYDIGHVFTTANGGKGAIGSVCVAGQKAHGVTGRTVAGGGPVGDPFDVDYVAHEMGHQFGANHTFNGQGGSCQNARTRTVAFEPGSGSTIMSYAGICDTDDLQPHSDPQFHSFSQEQILAHITDGPAGGCAALSALGNGIPTVNAGRDYVIPRGTPFKLTGRGRDDDGDPVTFLWEERDLGPQAALTAVDDGMIPLFRVLTPQADPFRFFPEYNDVLTNTFDDHEKLPNLDRTMSFKLTVRDGNGGFDSDDMTVTVEDNAGPFRGPRYTSSSMLECIRDIYWEVANTNLPPINVSHVNIYMSTDGGLTWPITLACRTPNDGAAVVRIPLITTDTARIKIEPVGNVFYALSDNIVSVRPCACEEGFYGLRNGSFERDISTPDVLFPQDWQYTDLSAGNPICTSSICGPGARTGDRWARFGGDAPPDSGIFHHLEQQIFWFDQKPTRIEFYLRIQAAGGQGDFYVYTDFVDDLFHVTQDNAGAYSDYTLVSIDLSGIANPVQTLTLRGSASFGRLVFDVDDVCLINEGILDEGAGNPPSDCGEGEGEGEG